MRHIIALLLLTPSLAAGEADQDAPGHRVFVADANGTFDGIPASFVIHPRARPPGLTAESVHIAAGSCWVTPIADANGRFTGFCIDEDGERVGE